MILAVSDAVWLAILGIIGMVVKEFLVDRPRAARVAKELANATLARAAQTSKVEEVAESVKVVAEKVEEVHKATNSLTDRLVETTKSEAHAAGIKEEKDRADQTGS